MTEYVLSENLKKNRIIKKLQKRIDKDQLRLNFFNPSPKENFNENLFILMHYRFIPKLVLEGSRPEQLQDFSSIIYTFRENEEAKELSALFSATLLPTSGRSTIEYIIPQNTESSDIYLQLRKELITFGTPILDVGGRKARNAKLKTEWEQYKDWLTHLKAELNKLDKIDQARHEEVINAIDKPKEIKTFTFNIFKL